MLSVKVILYYSEHESESDFSLIFCRSHIAVV